MQLKGKIKETPIGHEGGYMEEVPTEVGKGLAVVYKIQTLVDGGARVTLDLGLDSSELITKILAFKMTGNEFMEVSFTLGVQ